METENEENNENGGKKMTSDIFDDLFGGFDAMNRRYLLVPLAYVVVLAHVKVVA